MIDTEQDDLPLRENVTGQMQLGVPLATSCVHGCSVSWRQMGLLTAAGWFTTDWIDRVLDAAPQHFDRAFDRWRELYHAATRQLLEAQNALLRARRPEEQAQATFRQQEALRQRNLLLQVNTMREESDFYPYRYLASEGFLPGYNFPALPIRAVPRGEGEFVARPRFRVARVRTREHPVPRRRQVGGGQPPGAPRWPRRAAQPEASVPYLRGIL